MGGQCNHSNISGYVLPNYHRYMNSIYGMVNVYLIEMICSIAMDGGVAIAVVESFHLVCKVITCMCMNGLFCVNGLHSVTICILCFQAALLPMKTHCSLT